MILSFFFFWSLQTPSTCLSRFSFLSVKEILLNRSGQGIPKKRSIFHKNTQQYRATSQSEKEKLHISKSFEKDCGITIRKKDLCLSEYLWDIAQWFGEICPPEESSSNMSKCFHHHLLPPIHPYDELLM